MARTKKPKRCTRSWFAADLAVEGDRGVLAPRRGAHRVVVVLGEDIDEHITAEPHRELRANLGDHLILCGRTPEETQDAEVVRVEQDGHRDRLHVRLGYGGPVHPGAVRVLHGRRAA